VRVSADAAPPVTAPARLRAEVAWPTLIMGIVFVGVGLGMMIYADFGVAPIDALFTAVSRTSGLSVGIVLAVLSILMVLMAWALGVRPALGTLVSFLGIALCVDLTRAVGSVLGVTGWSLGVLIVWWVAGLAIFCLGVAGIFGADRGVSPYDLLTLAVSLRTGRSLGVSRLIVDAIALVGAIALGGSWGVGTVVILLAVPATLNVVLPRVKSRLHRIGVTT